MNKMRAVLAAVITAIALIPAPAMAHPQPYTGFCPSSGTVYQGYRFIKSGPTYPGNPSMGISYYQNYKHYYSYRSSWVYDHTTLHAC